MRRACGSSHQVASTGTLCSKLHVLSIVKPNLGHLEVRSDSRLSGLGTRDQILHLHEARRTRPYGLDDRLQMVDTRSYEDVDEGRPTPEQSQPHAPPPDAGSPSTSDRGSNQKKHLQRTLRTSEDGGASACSSADQKSLLREQGVHQSEVPLSRSTQGDSVVVSGTGRRGPQHPRRSGLVSESSGSNGSWSGSVQRRRPSKSRRNNLDIAASAAVAGVGPL